LYRLILNQQSFLYIFLLVLFIGASSIFLHGYLQLEKEHEPVYFVDTREKKVAFSFEILWEEGYLEEVLEVLNEKKINGTFFLTGEWVENHPELSEEILQKGNEVGNHSMSHRSLLFMSEKEIYREISSFTSLTRELFDYTPSLFRPPFGEYNHLVVETASRENYITVLWSIESRDYTLEEGEKVKKHVLDNLHPGAIINIKVNSRASSSVLPLMIKEIKNRGYKMVTVSELME